MKVEALQEALSVVEDNAEPFHVDYWIGIFEVLIVLYGKGYFNEDLYKSYLSDFIQVDSYERGILEEHAPEILKELDSVIE